MAYLPDMEVLHDSDITEEVLAQRKEYDSLRYTAADVRSALAKENRSLQNFAALLSPAAIPLLEEITTQAKAETRKHFGNSICIFTPLYLANYCENGCVYCGFNRSHTIRRAQLTPAEMEREMRSISGTGLEEILLLTGESKTKSDLHYIGEACTMAHRYFKMTGLEVYPMNTQEYASLQACGADFVTVFQETYDIERYEALHPSGRKRVFPYRLNAQERALRGGMRGVGFGHCWASLTSERTPLPPAYTHGCCREIIPMQSSLSPAPDFVPLPREKCTMELRYRKRICCR